MQSTRRWLLFALMLIGALVSLFVLVAPQTRAQQTAAVPPVGLPGTEFRFSGDGFLPHERVTYWIDRPDGTVKGNSQDYVTHADQYGRAEWTWRAPAGAISGTWFMVARGADSGFAQRIPFEISTNPRQGDPTGQQAAAVPPIGSAGTRFLFVARGFAGDERVSYWLNVPDGSIVGGANFVTTADDGRAEWSWQSPASAPRGTWQMVARGSSGVERIINFEVR